MAREDNVWVKPGDKRWDVDTEGGKHIGSAPTQAEATKIGRTAAQQNQAELIVLGLDGKIQSRDSHGNETKAPDKNGRK